MLGGLTLRNRIVWLPHFAAVSEADDTIGERYVAYYVERARGGAGLIITGSENANPAACNWAGRLNAYESRHVPAYRDLAERVHEHGAAIFGQISDDGLEGSGVETLDWNVPRGPSATRDELVQVTGREMDEDDIADALHHYAISAAHHREGGFDGIELKAGHDGLLRQFMSPATNRRTDAYGGGIENRLRFLHQAVEAVRAEVGRDWVVGLRLSLDEGLPDGYGLDEGVELARRIGEWGAVDYLNADLGSYGNLELMNPDMSVEQGFAVDAGARARAASGLPVIAFGRIKEPVHAEAILRDGAADLVGLARPLITDPEWPQKAKRGDDKGIRYCIACNQACLGRVYDHLSLSCILNPAAGREREWRSVPAAQQPRRVVVVGGGPAGMKCAEILRRRRHEVVLVERSAALGGRVNLLYELASRREFTDGTAWIADQLELLGIPVHLGMEVTTELLNEQSSQRPVVSAFAVGPPATPGSLLELEADAVVFATGARPLAPALDDGSVPTFSILDAFLDQDAIGQRVLLWDEELGTASTAAAEHLAQSGRELTIVTPADHSAARIPRPNLEPQLTRLKRAGVATLPHSGLHAVRDGRPVLANAFTGAETVLPPVDAVVTAVGWKTDAEVYAAYRARWGDRLVRVGDCEAPRDVGMAIYGAELLARRL